MGVMLRLYRGDFEKIREFDVSKTNKYCLVGKGIYLTDSLKIAESYRTKGMVGRMDTHINLVGHRRFVDMGAAMNAVFNAYLEAAWQKERQSSWQEASPKAKELFRVIHLDVFDRLKARGEIKIDADRAPGSKEVNISAIWSLSGRAPGYLSMFEFDNTDGDFDRRIVDLGKRIINPEIKRVLSRVHTLNPDGASEDEYIRYFDDILYEHNLYHVLYCGRRSFPEAPLRIAERERTIVTGKKAAKKKRMRTGAGLFNLMATKFKEEGYLGFEYPGGVLTSGYNTHRAFCVWDDDFVNEHFVKRL